MMESVPPEHQKILDMHALLQQEGADRKEFKQNREKSNKQSNNQPKTNEPH
jgi:hypothetical protein